MAVLLPASRLANVEQSLTDYLRSTLGAAGVALLFLPMAATATLPVRRVEVDYVPLAHRRDTGRVMDGIGHEREILVNCNCLEQRGTTTPGQFGLYSLPELIDKVYDVFAPQAYIPIKDYDITPTPPVVGRVMVRSIQQNNVPVPAGTPVEIRNVSIRCAYEESYA
jgi:hypothetical protein